MNRIKIIDLFNMISKGKEVPKKIKYKDVIYEYNINNKQYYELGHNLFDYSLRYELYDFKHLNDEVEIIEEDEKIEKLPYYSLERIRKAKNKYERKEERIKLLEIRADDYHKKINELINEVNQLKEK